MQQLLELLDKTPSRFIPLGDGQFLALTRVSQTPRRIAAFSENIVKVYASPLATLGLKDLIDEVGKVKADKHWKAHIQLEGSTEPATGTLYVPSRTAGLPNGRVQLAGPSGPLGWELLGRSNGTGKTVQALAVILKRAHGDQPNCCPHFRVHELGEVEASPYPQYRSIWWERQQLLNNYNRLICWYAATVC